MAEVHSMTCRIGAEGARRLARSIAATIDQNGDLSSRGLQIRSIGQSLEPLVDALRCELLRIGQPEELDTFMAWIEPVARLAHLARTYPGDQLE